MNKVAKTARVISYLAKEADQDEMDLYFAGDTTKSIQCRSSSDVESAINKRRNIKGRCNMRKCLNDILRPVWARGGRFMKPTSIYVFTDGVWEPGDDLVGGVINQSIQQLLQASKSAETLMFQFIRFGNDSKGELRLQELDDNFVEHHSQGE